MAFKYDKNSDFRTQQMVYVIQVPAKYSYFVIRGKFLRLRILRKNCDNFDMLNSLIDSLSLNRTLCLFLLKNINV